MRTLFVLFAILFTISGCVKRGIEKSYYEKFDAKLKLLMKEPEYSKSQKPIRCVIEMYKNMDYILKDKLESVGLKVITTAGNIIIVEGSSESLHKASRYDFIHRISLSQEYQVH